MSIQRRPADDRTNPSIPQFNPGALAIATAPPDPRRMEVIPGEKAYRYTAATDTISPVARTAADAKRLYADAIAQISLGIMDAVLRADSHQDHEGHSRRAFDTVVFNGVVDAIDPAACLWHLGASVSKSPAELVPVRPVLEFSMVDSRFVADTDVLGGLDTRTNLWTSRRPSSNR